MATFKKMPNYREMYPEASEAVIKCLREDHRKMEYMEYDLKAERCRVCHKNQTVTFIPSREDSLERLLSEDKQFQSADEPLEDRVVRSVLIAKMLDCVNQLSDDERELIHELYFCGKSEREWSAECGVPQKTLNDRKNRVLGKLKKLMEKRK